MLIQKEVNIKKIFGNQVQFCYFFVNGVSLSNRQNSLGVALSMQNKLFLMGHECTPQLTSTMGPLQ